MSVRHKNKKVAKYKKSVKPSKPSKIKSMQQYFNEWYIKYNSDLDCTATFIEYWMKVTGNNIHSREFQRAMKWIVTNCT